MMEPKDCNHTYGFYMDELIDSDSYNTVAGWGFTRFTYCPWCRTQLYTIDGEPLGISLEEKDDDCKKGGCAD
jgi:hypothetical protein